MRKEKKVLKLSIQACGAFMMCLQVCLVEERDILPLLQALDLEVNEAGELIVQNPPVVTVPDPK